MKGPPFAKVEMPGGSKLRIDDKTVLIVNQLHEIQEVIQETVASKFSTEIVAKLALEAGVGVWLLGKLLSEIRSKSVEELTDAVQTSVARKRCFQVQITREITHSVELPPRAGRRRKPRILNFYLYLWPWEWDFYLYRVRYLRLRHRRNWLWKQVSDTISTASVELKWPLFRMRYYEPQDKYSVKEGEYKPDVPETDANDVRTESFSGEISNIRFPSGQSLEDLALAAFPVSRKEKTRVKAFDFVSLAGHFRAT